MFTLLAQEKAQGCPGQRVSPPTLKGTPRVQLATAQQGGQPHICLLPAASQAVLCDNAVFVPGSGTSEGVNDTEKL